MRRNAMPTQKAIKNYLLSKDRQLEPVITTCPYPRSHKNKDIYLALLSSIVSQQLSIKAAQTIFDRLLDLFDGRYPYPETLSKINVRRLRSVGLSLQKSGYVKNVAKFALQGEGLNYSNLQRHNDEELMAYLTQIKGVGRWTVEMLLMFPLNRPDVFSADDLGIQQTMKKIYDIKLQGRELKQQMHEIAQLWQPYRSIVCKYLWHWKSVTTKNKPGLP